MKYFGDNLSILWDHDVQIFYRQMLDNSGLMEEIGVGGYGDGLSPMSKHKKKKNGKGMSSRNYQEEFYNCQQIKSMN